ncbi:MAG: sulfite exporter TauE/SafE family protein [Methylophilus sp.]|jgi:hypothetical protein
MTLLSFVCLVLLLSFFTGIVGALTGLGGGVLLIPILVLFLNVNMHYAMGAGLFAVMATSAGTAIAYLREGYINIRIGMFLEVAAAAGALAGAYATHLLSPHITQVIFGGIFLVMAYLSWRRKEELDAPTTAHPWANYLKLNGNYPTPQGMKSYFVSHVTAAFSMMGVAGVLSGLLGIGAGSFKVVAMDQAMRLPYKVSTSTSNFIIGITAAVSAGVFYQNGYINPIITFPVVIGVLLGALLGARIMPKIPVKPLRLLFSVVILWLAIEMINAGLRGLL